MNWEELLGGAWLLGLTGAGAVLAARVARVEAGQRASEGGRAALREELGALRADLRDVARSQQVEEVRRLLVADLRPLIADTVDLRIAAHPPAGPHPGIAFSGPATVAGPLVGGDAGSVATGAPHAE